jgi:AraC family transcriptional regulator
MVLRRSVGYDAAMPALVTARGPSAAAEAEPPSTLLLDTGTVRVGRFRISPRHPNFAAEGQMRRHEFVFPRTSVWIEHPGRRPFVADPTTVTFYNRDEPYARRELSPEGDRCEWYAVEPSLLEAVVRDLDPEVADRSQRPFRFTHGPVDPVSYARQRLVAHHVATEAVPDPLFVEVEMIAVLRRVLRQAYERRGARTPRPSPLRDAAEIVARATAFGLPRLGEKLTLRRFAAAAGCTPFHLCRAVRAVSGDTLHAWLVRLRLQVSLERVAEPRSDLTEIALDLGFSSHSHFTQAFHHAFGVPPSEFRRGVSSRALAGLAAALSTYSGRSPRAGSGRKKLAAKPMA